jgi:uncharacterized protein
MPQARRAGGPFQTSSLDYSHEITRQLVKTLDIITFVLLIIGGLNWGLLGLFSFDLVTFVFGEISPLNRVVYVLVGLSALYYAIAFRAILQRWRPRAARLT